eukprot:scpid64473/ scgid7442/ Palmitoyltransferase ZDHHC3; GABA-A receptor-associated membrane protein 1; Golgi-specific DHHC zinc finger protein; Zinc finger DHHC domain-containing protein 3
MFQICFRFLKSEEKLWCVRDTCGIACVVTTYLLLLYGVVATTLTVLLPYPTAWTLFQYIIFVCLVFLAACSHVRTMLTDPGTVPKGVSEFTALQDCEETDNAVIKHCHKCNSIKPLRAHHCSVCNRCIMKMDHHCPWVNNCVGENNQKYFVLFTLYIFALSVLGVYMTISRALSCSYQKWQGCLLFNEASVIVLMILLAIEGFLFALFLYGNVFHTSLRHHGRRNGN